MIISLVVAMDRQGVIGVDNGLPWHLPADLRRFKATTMGHPIVMGRKTHQSIGRALPGRTNIVISRDPHYRAEGCLSARSFDAALAHCGATDEVMVIGGATVYAQALGHADRIYLTLIDAEFHGDTRFPEFEREAWRETAREDYDPDEKNAYPLSFLTLERIVGAPG